MEEKRMNDCWDILGIEPTKEKREVRSAYAARSRMWHMEENPEEFARLNQAYQEALAYASAGEGRRGPEQGISVSYPQEVSGQDMTQQDEKQEEKQESSSSLLQRLQQAEEAKVEESMAEGALKSFIAIFEGARESGKVPRAAVWKEFFLSEEFLKEQYGEGFARGMLQYLSEWSMEGNYSADALPSPFLLELAIAYALMPEEINHFLSGRNQYETNVLGDFYGRECAASLWNGQSGRGSLPVRILYKPENLVRLRSFSDYIRLRSLNQNNLLTSGNKDSWERILVCGCVNHLYEQNGKGNHTIYEETRSVCLIRLYTFWVQAEEIPACVLEYMYKEYNLKNVEHSSSKKIYGPLRQAILKRYPDIEKVLYGAESRIQMEREWYRDLTKINADNHSNYDKGIYEETEEIKERVRELFARPEWKKIQYSKELFDRMFGEFYRRMVVSESLAKRLIDFYTEGQKEGRWEDTQKVSIMIQSLIQSHAFNRRIRDIDGLQPLGFGTTSIEDISDDNRDFWYYYLMVGFGFRRAELDSGTESTSSLYMLGSSCYLPLYIKYTYYPARQWIKQFVGYSAADGTDRQNVLPIAVEFCLPDGKSLRVEFHLHYCLYILEGEPVCQPVYTFGEFTEMAGKLPKTEQFFFLLAITEIGEDHRAAAQKLIEERLSRLVLYPSTIPLIARMLASGTEELVQTSDYTGDSSLYKKAVPVNMVSCLPDEETAFEDPEYERIEAIYYTEQEDSCFRVLVTDQSVRLYHQRNFGWHELPVQDIFGQPEQREPEERKRWAEKVLGQLYKPGPVSLGKVSLSGMEKEEKAVKILEALRRREEYRRREKEWDSSVPVGEVPAFCETKYSGVMDFFQKEGSFLTESYCVLRFGPEKKNERVLYCGIYPYAFQAKEHNPDFESTYQFRLKELSKKIKENHQILGNFGWGDVYTPKEVFEPSPFAVGESGTYYNFDVFRMYRTDNLAALLAKMFDLTHVTEVETYQGCLSFSRLDKKLEYCYGEEALRRSMYSPDITDVDVFVRFTRAERMAGFARWMNRILAQADRLGMPLFVLEQQRDNVYSLSLRDRRVPGWEERPEQEEDLMGENCPLIWKLWDIPASIHTIIKELEEWVPWYMDHGRYGRKLKKCLRVDAVAYTTPGGSCRQEETGHICSKWEIYKNTNGVLEAMKRRTAMTAYSLTEDRKEAPSLFDTKVGGLPYWNPEKEYPEDSNGKKMALLAQINLDKDPMEDLIPGGGMLQFFGAADEIFRMEYGSQENSDFCRIVYHRQVDYHISREELIQLGVPDSTKCYEGHTPVSGEALMKVEKSTVYMGMEDYRFYEVLKEVIGEEFGLKPGGDMDQDKSQDEEACGFQSDLLDFLGEEETDEMEDEFSNDGFWILGYPAFASNRKDPRQKNEELRKYDRLLFQFDVHYLSDDYYFRADNECGIAQFFIRSEDLANQDFGKVMYHWENCTDEEEDYEE